MRSTEPAGGARPAAGLSGFLRLSLALHAAAPIALLVAPRLWPFVVGGLVADHAVVVSGGLLPRSRILGRNLVRLDTEEPVVALTFDDGPDPGVTPRVLDALDRRGARASFFCIGERAQENPDLVAAIARAGHTVENHTYHHPVRFFFLGPAALRREIDGTQRVLEDACGRAPAWFRAPAGIRGPLLAPMLARRGLGLASWTRRGFDTVRRDPEGIARRLLDRVTPGDILLLHDGTTLERRAGWQTVVATVDLVLDGLGRRGLRALPLPRTDGGVGR